jgi:hypothetical protein
MIRNLLGSDNTLKSISFQQHHYAEDIKFELQCSCSNPEQRFMATSKNIQQEPSDHPEKFPNTISRKNE